MKLLITVVASIFLWCSSVSSASAQDVSYYGFEPDITTNYLKEGNDYRLGFIRVAIEVMVPDPSYISVVEHHAPLLRNAFVSILSTATERQVRTMTGRDQLRLKCVERAQELMQQETGNPVIRDVIFTKYIYQ
ncbi:MULTISPECIES: flagellar basal body-associated protein FliL [Idiomarina]|jgi:flagellar FliL protein|uniref:Flagellar protein FliL n=2 Tax=Idiomarina abyssalis TaxID=86102 RepID=A0A8I1KF14_9GAMM|nr:MULTISPECIES: flagellar basal body-associated protein FliL [Idiomarina]KPD20703.1 flagellar basal body-associated protein FliL-like protein [Idiomarina abyssalis]MAB21426.1 flagellar basal body-associated protein FliL [Idiomarina sp.]MBE93270.1 flagellar basal body-associated protein FliL [Idiomarina sp.]MBF79591.1 flagellar basal body-associated protein FliL [Idiomarina sp.]MBH93499.1 flagellar basal body-associated protein FliL [Idiomarina sp.]|tara:strand:- start:1798 stop:2196 length:399 start_codon:yes stop_codon:yes gene_type:complete